jgi:hypothetical protein
VDVCESAKVLPEDHTDPYRATYRLNERPY